jgi:hypothetical protein
MKNFAILALLLTGLAACEKPTLLPSEEVPQDRMRIMMIYTPIIQGSDWSPFIIPSGWYQDGYDLFSTDTTPVQINFAPTAGVQFALEAYTHVDCLLIVEFLNPSGQVIAERILQHHDSHQYVWNPEYIYGNIASVRIRFSRPNGGYLTFINLIAIR